MAASITFNGKELTHKIDILQQRQLPFIASLTLNGRNRKDVSLASEVQLGLIDHMESTFEGINRETTKFIVRRSKASIIRSKGSDFTEIKHKDEEFGIKGTPPSKYLRPQIVGGPVERTRFQKSLSQRTGKMPRRHYMMPLYGNGAGYWGRLPKGEYSRALWGIRAMEQFRGTNQYIGKTNYRTADSYIHVPFGIGKQGKFDTKGAKKQADFIRHLNKKSGESFTRSLPPAGIYKVNKGGLKPVFKQLERLPTYSANHYKFRQTSKNAVSKNYERIFRMKVREVLGR